MAKPSKKPVFRQEVIEHVKTEATGVAKAIAALNGQTIPPVVEQEIKKVAVQPNVHHWRDIDAVREQTRVKILSFAQDINMLVEKIKSLGTVREPVEFSNTVRACNSDFHRFMGDFERIKARHAGKEGEINTPEDMGLMFSVFEDYQSFNAFFDGTMYGTLQNFTDYALQAEEALHVAKVVEEKLKEEENAEHPAA